MRTLGIDWNGSYLVGYFEGDSTPDEGFWGYEWRDFYCLLDSLTEPTRLVWESSSPSFPHTLKWDIIEKSLSAGHRVEQVRSTSTPIRRDVLGYPKKSSNHKNIPTLEGISKQRQDDAFDAITILDLALDDSYQTHVPRRPSAEWLQKMEITQQRVMAFRNHYVDIPGKSGSILKPKKAIQVLLTRSMDLPMPWYINYVRAKSLLLPTAPKQFTTKKLFMDEVWSADVVNIVAWAQYEADNRSQFEGLVAMYGHGNACQQHATMKRHLTAKPTVRAAGWTLNDIQHGARWLRHQLPERSFFDEWLDRVSEETGMDLRDRASCTPEKGKINPHLV